MPPLAGTDKVPFVEPDADVRDGEAADSSSSSIIIDDDEPDEEHRVVVDRVDRFRLGGGAGAAAGGRPLPVLLVVIVGGERPKTSSSWSRMFSKIKVQERHRRGQAKARSEAQQGRGAESRRWYPTDLFPNSQKNGWAESLVAEKSGLH